MAERILGKNKIFFKFRTKATSCYLSECRILMLLSLPIALANYLLIHQNVPLVN